MPPATATPSSLATTAPSSAGYKGKPLYTFAKDQKPGDVSGDGFLNGAWHLAMP